MLVSEHRIHVAVQLPQACHEGGLLLIVEAVGELPFEIRRDLQDLPVQRLSLLGELQMRRLTDALILHDPEGDELRDDHRDTGLVVGQLRLQVLLRDPFAASDPGEEDDMMDLEPGLPEERLRHRLQTSLELVREQLHELRHIDIFHRNTP